jgi:hypothetical protein
VKAILAPCLANWIAMPLPIPLDAPVINATLSCNNFMLLMFYGSAKINILAGNL